MRALKSVVILALALGLVACGDNNTTTDGKTLTDGPVAGDGSPDGPVTNPDMGIPDGGSTAALQTVMNKLSLPTSATDFAIDLDGDSNPDNQLGAILAALAAAQFDTQGELDSQINQGLLSLLFELFSQSLTDDATARLQFHMGAFLGTTPLFDGTDQYAIAISSPANVVLNSTLTAGKLAGGPGDFQIPIPMGATSILVDLKQTRVKGDVSSTGITNGQINGAVPWTTVDGQLIPAIAAMINTIYTDPNTPLQTVALLKGLLDGNADGTIDANDIRNSGVLKSLLKPDLDLDKDGTKDAMSVGMGFTAVKCTIQ